MWVCVFPAHAPTGSVVNPDHPGTGMKRAGGSQHVSELSKVLGMRMPTNFEREDSAQIGTAAGPASGAGRGGARGRDRHAQQEQPRQRSNTIGDSQETAPELVFSSRDIPYLVRMWDGQGRSLTLQAESTSAGQRAGLALRLTAKHHSRSREPQSVATEFPVIQPGRWHHVTIVQGPSTMFGGDGQTTIYVDGSPAAAGAMRLPNFQP